MSPEGVPSVHVRRLHQICGYEGGVMSPCVTLHSAEDAEYVVARKGRAWFLELVRIFASPVRAAVARMMRASSSRLRIRLRLRSGRVSQQ